MSGSTMMTEIAITQFGDPAVLQPQRVTVPKPQSGELLIRVHAAGVNRPDVLQRLVDLDKIMTKRITVTGSAMRPRTLKQKSAIAESLHKHVWPHLGAGRIEPVIHATFPLAQAAEAHRLMESNKHIGKIVLTA